MTESQYKTANLDVVYFCKDGPNEELKYSLRSIEKNLAFARVWIYGGKPDDIQPDKFVAIPQTGKPGETKWDRVRANFRRVGLNKEITEDFILMNDDFFINKTTTELPPTYRCSLYEHILKIEMKYGDRPTDYTLQLRKTLRDLDAIGATTNSYELHTPVIINRHKLLEILGAFPNTHATRTLYGNYFAIGGEETQDVKYIDPKAEVDTKSRFLSSDDSTWGDTKLTKFIKEKYPDPSRFELDNKTQAG